MKKDQTTAAEAVEKKEVMVFDALGITEKETEWVIDACELPMQNYRDGIVSNCDMLKTCIALCPTQEQKIYAGYICGQFVEMQQNPFSQFFGN